MFCVGARCLHAMVNPIVVIIGCTKTIKSMAFKFIIFYFLKLHLAQLNSKNKIY
jgi:hypothetical protein